MVRSVAIEDYVRAIYQLQQRESPVATMALARRMRVAPASATGMLKRLHALGLVAHEPYAGVTLTGAGERMALEVIRHHRLIETYLAEALGVSWDQVHDEAHRLEHHISEALEDRMAEVLGHPLRDPHGAPIPPKEGPFAPPVHRLLTEFGAGVRLVIREVMDEDADRLRALGRLGLRPDVVVTVLRAEPEEPTITLGLADVADVSLILDRSLAATLWVEDLA
jgi:DtxR family Mn-dependent transcriptional regulator